MMGSPPPPPPLPHPHPHSPPLSPPPLRHPPQTIPSSRVVSPRTSCHSASHPSSKPTQQVSKSSKSSAHLPPLPPPQSKTKPLFNTRPQCSLSSAFKAKSKPRTNTIPNCSLPPAPKNGKTLSSSSFSFSSPQKPCISPTASSSQRLSPASYSSHDAADCHQNLVVKLPVDVEPYVMEGSKAELIEHVAWLRVLLSETGTRQNELQFTVCKLKTQIADMSSGKLVSKQASLIDSLRNLISTLKDEFAEAHAKLKSFSMVSSAEDNALGKKPVTLSGRCSDHRPLPLSNLNLNSKTEKGKDRTHHHASAEPVPPETIPSCIPFSQGSPRKHNSVPLSPPEHANTPTNQLAFAGQATATTISTSQKHTFKPHFTSSSKSWADIVKQPPTKMSFEFFKPTSMENKTIVEPPKDVADEGNSYWKHLLVGSFVQKRPPFSIVQPAAMKLWQAKGLQQVFVDGKGLFYFKFDSESSMHAILASGPFSIAGRHLQLQQWSGDCSPVRASSNTALVWVRFYNIPLQFWTAKGLSHIASAIGRPLHADHATETRQKLKFARICIELNLDCPLKEVIALRNSDGKLIDINVEYQWIPKFCTSCKNVGHTTSLCHTRKSNALPPKPKDQSSEEWQIVHVRKPNPKSPASLPLNDSTHHDSPRCHNVTSPSPVLPLLSPLPPISDHSPIDPPSQVPCSLPPHSPSPKMPTHLPNNSFVNLDSHSLVVDLSQAFHPITKPRLTVTKCTTPTPTLNLGIMQLGQSNLFLPSDQVENNCCSNEDELSQSQPVEESCSHSGSSNFIHACSDLKKMKKLPLKKKKLKGASTINPLPFKGLRLLRGITKSPSQ